MEKFKQKYRIPSARLKNWDYGSPGLYFVTICTKNRQLYFGAVEAQNFASLDARALTQNFVLNPDTQTVETQDFASLQDSQIDAGPEDAGSQNAETQNLASLHYQQINISPENHGSQNVETQNIASLRYTDIGNIANQYWLDIRSHFPFVELDEYMVMPNHVHGILFLNKPDYTGWQPNKFGPQSKNLGSIIRGYKVGVKAYATTNQIEFAWQARFHDHIIKSEKELNNIRQYIINNPAKWYLDKDNPENLMM